MRELPVTILGFGMMGTARAVAYEAVMRYYGNTPIKPVLYQAYTYTDAEAAGAAATGWEATKDLDAAITNPKTEYVDVCLPNSMHCDAVLKALAAGKHVFCEKPLSVTVEEAHKMVDAAAAKPELLNSVNFIYRRVPANVYARKLVKDAVFGKLLEARSFYNQAWGGPDTDYSWRFSNTGGTLGDLGSHALDMLYYTTGMRPIELCAMQSVHIPYRYKPATVGSDLEGRYNKKATDLAEVWADWRKDAEAAANGGETSRPMVKVDTDDVTRIMYTLPGGAVGSLECTRNAWGTENTHGYELYFERGAIRWNYDDMNYLGIYDASKPERGWARVCCNRGGFAYPSFADGHMFGYRDLLVNACYENMLKIAGQPEVAPVASFQDALDVERTIEAVRKSWSEKRWVKLEEIA